MRCTSGSASARLRMISFELFSLHGFNFEVLVCDPRGLLAMHLHGFLLGWISFNTPVKDPAATRFPHSSVLVRATATYFIFCLECFFDLALYFGVTTRVLFLCIALIIRSCASVISMAIDLV